MKMASMVALAFFLAGLSATTEATNPIAKVVSLLLDLEAKVTKEGADAKTVFSEFTTWYEDQSRNLAFEIKTGKGEVADLKARIEEEAATIGSLTAKVEDLVAEIAKDDKDLKAAVAVRTAEQSDFAVEDKELTETISMLERAILVLEREANRGGASMLQTKNSNSVIQVLSAMVEASSLSNADASKLSALVQMSKSDDEDAALGAPDPATYESHAGSITATLEGLLDKTQSQLAGLRGKEMESRHNADLLKQSLEDSLKFANKNFNVAKKGMAASAERKSIAEGDLSVTEKDLNGDIVALEDLERDGMERASEYKAEVRSRAEELAAIAKAEKVIVESTEQAAPASFFQRSRLSSNNGVLHFVETLAQKQDSPALAQLVSRITSAIRLSNEGGADPFGKVKSLISDMLAKLEDQADADATHKAFCDKQMGETTEKKVDTEGEIGKLSTKIDQMAARSAHLKEEVSQLQKGLAQLRASQMEMNKLREEEHTSFSINKPEMEQGLEGVKMALKVLREYYAKDDKAHDAAVGAATSIIGLLEVVESDFTTGIAGLVATEESAQAAYEKETVENEVEVAGKEADVKYKTKEHKGLDKTLAETTADRAGVQAELDAVLEYLKKLKQQCVAKAETYEERTARRAAEIAGLKQALDILDGDAALLQKATKRARRENFLSKVCPSTDLYVTTGEDAAGKAVWIGPIKAFKPDVCYEVDKTTDIYTWSQNLLAIKSFKICGAGTFSLSPMSCKLHEHKQLKITHPKDEYIKDACKVYSAVDTVVEERVGSFQYACI